MDEMKIRFGLNLKEYRVLAGLTQIRLGEMISYTGKAVSKWESGKALPPAEVLPDLAAALGTDLNALFDFRETPSFYLGIDGGGTKTKFLLTDADGNVLNSIVLGACNPVSVGFDTCFSVLEDGIKKICGGIPYGKISVFAGIAGGTVGNNRGELAAFLEKFHFSKYGTGNDGENIIGAGLRGKDGVVAILGTGSVVFAAQKDTVQRIGGYGHFLGDCFSGSALGAACLKAAFREMDGCGSTTSMTAAVRERVGDNVSAALSVLYQQDKAYMASFSPILFDAAKAGDQIALEAIEENLREFASLLSAALQRFPIDETVPVVLAGGITCYRELFLDRLMALLDDPRLEKIEILESEPVVGALLRAGAPDVKEVH